MSNVYTENNNWEKREGCVILLKLLFTLIIHFFPID